MVKLLVGQEMGYRVIRHLFLFAGMVAVFTWVIRQRGPENTSWTEYLETVFLHAIFFFGYAYLTVYLLIPRFVIPQRFGWFAILFMGTGVLLSSVKLLISDFLFYHAIAPEDPLYGHSGVLQSLLVNTKDMSFIVALFAIAKYARDHYLINANTRELDRKGKEAELKVLQHHMDPHVVFNNLNSLYSISLYRTNELPGTLEKFRSFLRYLFCESRRRMVPLAREVAMIEDYISLERLRFGDRLNISFEREGAFEGYEIAPLIIYPFVENCFVHGAGEDPDNSWIRISIHSEGPRLRFHASNSFRRNTYQSDHYVRNSSNANVIRRLEIQYPNQHRLAIMERQTEYSVDLNLQLHHD